MYYKAVPSEGPEVTISPESIVDQIMDADLIMNFLQSRVEQILDSGEAIIPADDFLRILDSAIVAAIENTREAAFEDSESA